MINEDLKIKDFDFVSGMILGSTDLNVAIYKSNLIALSINNFLSCWYLSTPTSLNSQTNDYNISINSSVNYISNFIEKSFKKMLNSSFNRLFKNISVDELKVETSIESKNLKSNDIETNSFQTNTDLTLKTITIDTNKNINLLQTNSLNTSTLSIQTLTADNIKSNTSLVITELDCSDIDISVSSSNVSLSALHIKPKENVNIKTLRGIATEALTIPTLNIPNTKTIKVNYLKINQDTLYDTASGFDGIFIRATGDNCSLYNEFNTLIINDLPVKNQAGSDIYFKFEDKTEEIEEINCYNLTSLNENNTISNLDNKYVYRLKNYAGMKISEAIISTPTDIKLTAEKNLELTLAAKKFHLPTYYTDGGDKLLLNFTGTTPPAYIHQSVIQFVKPTYVLDATLKNSDNITANCLYTISLTYASTESTPFSSNNYYDFVRYCLNESKNRDSKNASSDIYVDLENYRMLNAGYEKKDTAASLTRYPNKYFFVTGTVKISTTGNSYNYAFNPAQNTSLSGERSITLPLLYMSTEEINENLTYEDDYGTVEQDQNSIMLYFIFPNLIKSSNGRIIKWCLPLENNLWTSSEIPNKVFNFSFSDTVIKH